MFRVDLIKKKPKRKIRGFYGRFFFSKQKFKAFYGFLTEGFFKRTYEKSLTLSHFKGTHKPLLSSIFISLIERRLDLILFRSGLFPSLYSARQAILHGHVLLNGRVVTFSSFLVTAGDVISFSEKIVSLLKIFFTNKLIFLSSVKDVALKRTKESKKKTHSRSFRHKQFKKHLKFKKTFISSHLYVDFSSFNIVLLKNFLDLKKVVYPFSINIQDVLMFYKI